MQQNQNTLLENYFDKCLAEELLYQHRFGKVLIECQQFKNRIQIGEMDVIQQINEHIRKLTHNEMDLSEFEQKTPENDGNQQNQLRREYIFSYMIQMIKLKWPFPQLLQFLSINSNGEYNLIFNKKLEKTLIETYLFYEHLNKVDFSFVFSDPGYQTSEEKLIETLIEIIIQNLNKIINQQIFRIQDYSCLKKLFQKQKLIRFHDLSLANKQIYLKIEALFAATENYLAILEINKNRQTRNTFIDSEIVKILTYFINQQQIIVPDLLLFLAYKSKYELDNTKYRQIRLSFSDEFLKLMSNISRINEIILTLKIPINYNNEKVKKDYQNFYINELSGFFQFIHLISIDEIIYNQIQLIAANIEKNKERLTYIFNENQSFKGLLCRLKLLYKEEINSMVYPDDRIFNSTQKNYILIVQELSKIRSEIQNTNQIIIPEVLINKIQESVAFNEEEDFEELQEFRKDMKSIVWGPKDYKYVNIFKFFIHLMNLQKIPFPQFLTIVQFQNYKFTVNCVKTTQQYLHQNKLYTLFLFNLIKSDQNIKKGTLKDKIINQKVDKVVKWPRCIWKQTLLINENKELLKVELKQIVQNQNFKKFYKELIEANERNDLRKQILDHLTQIFNYASIL